MHCPSDLQLDRQAGAAATIAAAAAAELVRAEDPAPPLAAVPVTRSTWIGPAKMAATGTGHPCAKLGPHHVRAIRRLPAEGMRTNAMATRFVLAGNTIRAILTRRTRRDVWATPPALFRTRPFRLCGKHLKNRHSASPAESAGLIESGLIPRNISSRVLNDQGF